MYIKPSKTFVLKKQHKTLIALSPSTTEQRHDFRRAMIQAQLASEIRPVSKKTRDVNNMPVVDAE